MTVLVDDLHVRYGRRTALAGLELALDTGGYGLLGPNGAGKTTLLRVLATLTRPHRGDVRLFGRPLGDSRTLREARRRLGYLPQKFGFYPRFTARECVEYVAWLKEVPTRDVPLAVDRALERVGLLDRADDRMGTLSGGMQRRVGIAQAIVNDPVLLLLDEPTAGLDPEQRTSVRQLLGELAADACVLVSTHLADDVADSCERIGVLDAGRLIYSGTPAALAADGSLDDGYRAALRDVRQEA